MRVTWKRLPRWVKNPYFLLGFSFLVWMLFFDAEDLVTQYKLRRKLCNLEAEKMYYLEQIEKIQQARKGLESNEDLLEKFAREKYFMKRKTEDLYVVVDE
jgi:cell division protein DivIC